MPTLERDGIVAESESRFGDELAHIVIRDRRHPGLTVRFEFREGAMVALVVSRDDSWAEISTSDLRVNFRWAKWVSVARDLAMDVMYPKSAGRLPRGSPPLQQVAEEYRLNVARKFRDPAGRIARKYGAKPATVRSWIRRARERGYLEPVPGKPYYWDVISEE
jgi:hypothetical protein